MGSFSKSEIQTFIKQFQINLLISVYNQVTNCQDDFPTFVRKWISLRQTWHSGLDARFDSPIDLPKEKLQHLCSGGSVWVGAQKQDTQHVVTWPFPCSSVEELLVHHISPGGDISSFPQTPPQGPLLWRTSPRVHELSHSLWQSSEDGDTYRSSYGTLARHAHRFPHFLWHSKL